MRSAEPRAPLSELDALLDNPVTEVARQLLGWRLRTNFGGITTEVQLNEVEAYAGDQDPASHAYRGLTARNAAMFEAPGTVYVYRSYGIHWCMNIVVGKQGVAHAVLLRGGKPTQGIAAITKRRGRPDHLADGPGKLCQAIGVTGDHNGTNLHDGPISLVPGAGQTGVVLAGPRVGISKAVDLPWRFVVAG